MHEARTSTSRLLAAIAAASYVFLTACTGTIEGEFPIAEDHPSLNAGFDAAGAEFDVPAALLKAVSYVESGWDMVVGEEDADHHGMPPAYGVMALRGGQLVNAAALAGVSEDAARADVTANIRAGAAWLDHQARELGIDRNDLGAWASAVGAASGIEDENARRYYVVDDVYGVLQEGRRLELEGGHLVASVEAIDVVPDYPAPDRLEAGGSTDFPGAIWRASPNNSARSSGNIGKVAMVVIHTCEGSYAGCWSWLANSQAGASAHYVVSKGGEISQLVRESRKAWHVAANYECSRNGGVDCWRNGYNSNNFTIGIEHAGFASQSSFPTDQLEASAKLVCDITRDYGIAVDNVHIVGHGKLQPWNRTDPGANWPWAHYLDRVRAHCGGAPDPTPDPDPDPDPTPDPDPSPASTIIIDSNNSRNDPNLARIEVSSNWHASSSVSGYFGTGYWWSSTESVSDGASFWFYVAADGTRTVDAWWTAATDRSTNAPFVAIDANGAVLGSVTRNEQTGGSTWNTLGTWSFKAGWNRIILSRWAAGGGVVIADAVRVR